MHLTLHCDVDEQRERKYSTIVIGYAGSMATSIRLEPDTVPT